jgi:gliding motility-associated-like protein
MAEWENERITWSEKNQRGALGSPLNLTVTLLRFIDGSIKHISRSYYWTSTVSGVFVRGLFFDLWEEAGFATGGRAYGETVRCIKDAVVAKPVVETHPKVQIPDVEIPDVFTPNGDNINDLWIIKNIEYYPDVEVSVYTQQGEKIFESKGYQFPWDGKYNGKLLPSGAYYYVITLYKGSLSYTGQVSIYR